MELTTIFFLVLIITSSSTAWGGIVGVDYGRDGNNLPSPPRVVELLKANGITAVGMYDSNAEVLRALANTGIKVTIAIPNDRLAAMNNPNVAGTWVWENIGVYRPATDIIAVAVGNEVFHQRSDLNWAIVPAMWNVYNAIKNLKLDGIVKVSTPVAFSAFDRSFPPSQGRFRGDLQPTVRQILDFISKTDSYFMINLYPYFTYIDNPQIDLNYALGLPNSGVRDPITGRMYFSLIDAQIDAVYTGIAALGFGDIMGRGNAGKRLVLREFGHPTAPRRRIRGGGEEEDEGRRSAMEVGKLGRERGPSVENAQTHNSIMVRRVLNGQTGTPLYPDSDLDLYLFALFNENLKPGPEEERNFGLFYPDGRKVYDIDFGGGGGGESWCVANEAVGNERLQGALDWACGPGGADCGPIQPGAQCFEPNTLVAHASYAMNSYYQKHGREASACNFNGAGRIVNQRPRFGNCVF
ncbi:glucan endo-1,3-beta-glucosidase 13-like [Wolffia australiana]